MDDYDKSAHAKYSLKVHIILVRKYRKEIFCTKSIIEDLKQSLYMAAEKKSCQIIQMESDKNHIHILLEYPLQLSVSTLVRWLKQYSTYYLWEGYPEYLSKEYWKRKIIWSDGYFACSIGQVSQDVIEKYIQNQG